MSTKATIPRSVFSLGPKKGLEGHQDGVRRHEGCFGTEGPTLLSGILLFIRFSLCCPIQATKEGEQATILKSSSFYLLVNVGFRDGQKKSKEKTAVTEVDCSKWKEFLGRSWLNMIFEQQEYEKKKRIKKEEWFSKYSYCPHN